MNVVRRPATTEDTEFARRVHHAAYRDVAERQFGPWDDGVQDRFFDADWRDAQHEIVLVDGTPCGYVSIEERDADIHVRELVLAPDFQGRGIGTTIRRRSTGSWPFETRSAGTASLGRWPRWSPSGAAPMPRTSRAASTPSTGDRRPEHQQVCSTPPRSWHQTPVSSAVLALPFLSWTWLADGENTMGPPKLRRASQHPEEERIWLSMQARCGTKWR